ncbi:hypothetical protein U3516DRAFT_846173 [Neocallimastix sp. 'constans']
MIFNVKGQAIYTKNFENQINYDEKEKLLYWHKTILEEVIITKAKEITNITVNINEDEYIVRRYQYQPGSPPILCVEIRIFFISQLSFEDPYKILQDVFYNIGDNQTIVSAKIITGIYDKETKPLINFEVADSVYTTNNWLPINSLDIFVFFFSENHLHTTNSLLTKDKHSLEKNQEIEISKINRRKEQIILNRKYMLNLSFKRKSNSKKYKCTEYKTLNKCPSFHYFKQYESILEYDDDLHNHLENKFEAAKSIVKNKNKDKISNSSISFNVNIKRKYDEISQDMLPSDIATFDKISNESKYYKTKRDENFMIFKNHNLIVFQSPFQAELFSKNKCIFFEAHFIMHQYLKSCKYNNIEITPKIFHCDFEKVISNTEEKVFSNYNFVQFLEFLKYYKKIYLINYDTENWNYYDNIDHIKNRPLIEMQLGEIQLGEMQSGEMQSGEMQLSRTNLFG